MLAFNDVLSLLHSTPLVQKKFWQQYRGGRVAFFKHQAQSSYFYCVSM
jgi:hypothetical protein